MHNLHLAVVRANDPQEACSLVETEISDWGTENNWRVVCGCVSEKNERYYTGEGRWNPVELGDTIESLNKWVESLMEGGLLWQSPKETHKEVKRLMRRFINGQEIEWVNWITLKKFCELQKEVAYFGKKEFNILEHNFFDYNFGENGVTNMIDREEGQRYVVYIDMHT